MGSLRGDSPHDQMDLGKYLIKTLSHEAGGMEGAALHINKIWGGDS